MKKTFLFFATLISSTLLITSTGSAQPGIIYTIAGDGTAAYYGDGLAATAAEMNNPDGVAIDSAGNIYFADYFNYRIRKISTAGIMSTVAGSGTPGYSGDGFAATAAKLDKVTGVAVDGPGNIYIADGDNNCIRKVNTAGIITTVAGMGGLSGFSGDGFAATNALMDGAYAVAVDRAGNIYIGDYNNERIRKVNTSGIITTIAGTGTPGYSGDGFAATSAMIYDPYSVAVDTSGNVFFTDRDNERIRKISTTGIITTVAGNGTVGYSGDGAAATLAQLNDPVSVSVDAGGNFYISEYGNNVVRKVNSAGIITTLAGIGSPGWGGDGGYATAATLNKSSGLAVDAYGNIILSDQNNERIRKITPSISVTGINTLCTGSTVTLSDSSSGGTWSSGSAAIASVGSLSGVVTGVSGGTVTITYSIFSVTATKVLTVEPAPAPITGIDSVCIAHTRTLTDATAGGTWTSSTTTIATVGSASGIVAGVTAGNSTITYSLPDGCVSVVPFKVMALPCISGIDETQAANSNEVTVYPNPATDELTIKTNTGAYTSFVITDELGRIMAHYQLTGTETNAGIRWLAPGLYFVAMQGGAVTKVVKFVKQ